MSKWWETIKNFVRGVVVPLWPPLLRRDEELHHLHGLPDVPYDENRPRGVLLSDQIENLATHWRMIEPFNLEKLKPAAYELSVGGLYSIGGQTFRLRNEAEQNEIVIKPFEVVVIQTLERLNLPKFLIARWNVRVKWAYEGLLWVGAAQVDPGYKGYLACPLYNLSDREVRLHFGEEIAVIDFVSTTPPTPNSKPYDPFKRHRILFEDYNRKPLVSALATQAQQKIQTLETEVRELRSKIDNSLAVIFTAIGIIVAALALFVAGQFPPATKTFSPSVLVAAASVAVALFLGAHTTYRHIRQGAGRLRTVIVFQLLALGVLVWIALELVRMRPN